MLIIKMKVEVFKTNVNYLMDAELLVREIENFFPAYSVNFDMEDCDRILRVETDSNEIQIERIIQMMNYNNFKAEILPDKIVSFKNSATLSDKRFY